MGRPLRDKNPENYRLITIRTDEARLWMIPSRKREKLLLGIIARYQEMFNIVIFAYCILSNHMHFLIQAPEGNTNEFMANVNREIARRMNWQNNRIGSFWARPYDDQKVITDDDLMMAFLYVTLNCTRHGLVKDPTDWGLLSSYTQICDEKTRKFTFTCYSEPDPTKRVTEHSLKLTPIPEFKQLSKRSRQKKTKLALDQKIEMIAIERFESKHGFLGIDNVKAQIPGSLPQSISRKPRPACYTSTYALYKEFVKNRRESRQDYDLRSMRFRAGEYSIEFPEFFFKPTLHYKPRLIKFKPLPDDYFSKGF